MYVRLLLFETNVFFVAFPFQDKHTLKFPISRRYSVRTFFMIWELNRVIRQAGIWENTKTVRVGRGGEAIAETHSSAMSAIPTSQVFNRDLKLRFKVAT